MAKKLVIGALGQVGTELIQTMRLRYGVDEVIASDIRLRAEPLDGPFLVLNALNEEALRATVKEMGISEVYLMAAMLSATAEQMPDKAWDLNMKSLFIVLDMAKDGLIEKVFWPSTIAVFGPNSEKRNSPQHGTLEPTTVYGISKLAGEQWCAYYHRRYGVDVRSLRYPGLIGYKSMPGGGTTDYAVEIFHKAIEEAKYTCFLSEQRTLPMMYMDDAIKATIDIMEAPAEQIKLRTSYNISSLSFSPEELAAEISKVVAGFQIDYAPDFRDSIAASWPESIDDSSAKTDWAWKSDFNLQKLVRTMIDGVCSLKNA
jgi:nucleoside-diphosphate-sugar epimerase